MPMKGRFPIRRTLQYLGQGDVVFKDVVKVMTVNYNTHGKLGEGARKFVFFNIPQIQYKNPWVQIMMFKNMTPSPFLRFYLGKMSKVRQEIWKADSGEQVLVDVETKSNKEIMEHIKKILGKNEKTLKEEEEEKKELSHPAHFGPRKYCLRECICEVEGQVPCPRLVPLPKEMTGKYKTALKAGAQD
nr:28S ribosomal protein S25, mitochondrial isoform X1 [Manis javanica]